MAFCRECGTKLPEGAAVCPSCGFAVPGAEAPTEEIREEAAFPAMEPLTQPEAAAEAAEEAAEAVPEAVPEQSEAAGEEIPVIAEEQPKKKMSGKKIAGILAALLAVAALIAVITFAVSANSPEKLITGALSRTANDLAKPEELKNSSVTLSADLNNWELSKLGLNEIPLAADLKLLFGGENALGLQANAVLDGETLLDLSGVLTPSAVAVRCDQLLPEVYGTDLAKLKEELPNSIFAPGKSAYSLDEETYQAVLRSLNDQQTRELTAKRWSEAVSKYLQLAIHAACEYGNAEKAGTDLTVGEETFKTTAVTLRLDENAVADVCTEIYNEFIKDEELRALLTEYAEGLSKSNPYLLGEEYDSVEEAIADLYENDLSQENFDNAMKELRESDIDLTPVFYVAKSNKHLAGFDLDYAVDGDEGNVSFKLGEDFKTSDCNALTVRTDELDLDITRYVTERSETAYSEKIIVKQDGERSLSTQYDLNKEKGTWTFELDPESEPLTFSGTCKTQDDTTEFAVKQLAAGGETVGLDLRVLLDRNDPAPEVPEYKEILSLSEDEVETLLGGIDDKLYDLGEKLGGSLDAAFGPQASDPGVMLPADTDLGEPEVGAGGDIVGVWDWRIEGAEDMEGILVFTFNEDGTGSLSSYGEEQPFVYETDGGYVTVTTDDGATDVFSYSVEGESLYMDIAGQVLEFVKK